MLTHINSMWKSRFLVWPTNPVWLGINGLTEMENYSVIGSVSEKFFFSSQFEFAQWIGRFSLRRRSARLFGGPGRRGRLLTVGSWVSRTIRFRKGQSDIYMLEIFINVGQFWGISISGRSSTPWQVTVSPSLAAPNMWRLSTKSCWNTLKTVNIIGKKLNPPGG